MTRDEQLIRAALEMAATETEECGTCAVCGDAFAAADGIRAIDPAEVLEKVLAEIPTEWPAPMPITMTYRNYRGEVSRREIVPTRLWFGTTEWHPEPGWMLSAFDLGKRAHRDFALADCQFKTENK